VLLHPVQHHSEPFEHFTCERALPPERLAELLGLFGTAQDWELHQTFYEAYLVDVSTSLAPAFRQALVARMRHLTGLPLTEMTRVTIQRMEPGQFAAAHTDRPLLGFEAARVIVQLNQAWRPGHGGVLLLHPDAAGQHVAVRRPPLFNTAIGFVMGHRSFHSVQRAVAQRRTVVCNFWHAANTPELAEWVREQFRGMRFDVLPSGLDDVAVLAEQTRPEEDSFRASSVAWLLTRWGADDEAVAAGYRSALDVLRSPDGPLNILFARWLELLAHGDFQADLWAALAPVLRDAPLPGAASVGLRLAFPAPAEQGD